MKHRYKTQRLYGLIITPSDALMRRHQTRDNTMKASELKRINRLLTQAATSRIMSDSASDKGDHAESLRWMRDESRAWVALSDEFGIEDGAIKVHRKIVKQANRVAA